MNEKIEKYSNRKYAIQYYLNSKLTAEAANQAMKEIPQQLGISERQFRRYMYAKREEPTAEARASYLVKIAAYLATATGENVEITDLIV